MSLIRIDHNLTRGSGSSPRAHKNPVKVTTTLTNQAIAPTPQETHRVRGDRLVVSVVVTLTGFLWARRSYPSRG